MLKLVKTLIKRSPRIYDFLDGKRAIVDPVEAWIDVYSRSKSPVFKFIQVGASDGLRWDPIRRFVIRDKWSGVFIEPLEPVFKILKSNYGYLHKQALAFENCAITNSPEDVVEFWTFSEEFLSNLSVEEKLYYLRKSSLDRAMVEKHLVGSDKVESSLACYKPRCVPLSQIIDEHFTDGNVDLVFIDAEGFDDTVIRTIDFNKCLPGAIVFEAHSLFHRKNDLVSMLGDLGYQIQELAGDVVAFR